MLGVWIILTLLDFAFLVCDFHQSGEGWTVSCSFPCKLRPRDLQKHLCFTLANATCMYTKMSTIATPACCMVFM